MASSKAPRALEAAAPLAVPGDWGFPAPHPAPVLVIRTGAPAAAALNPEKIRQSGFVTEND